jgi:hypothetical protein
MDLKEYIVYLSRYLKYVFMTPEQFFLQPRALAQKQYEALRMYFIEKKPAKEVAGKFGYTYRGFTTVITLQNEGKGKNEVRGPMRPGVSSLTLERNIIPLKISRSPWTAKDTSYVRRPYITFWPQRVSPACPGG